MSDEMPEVGGAVDKILEPTWDDMYEAYKLALQKRIFEDLGNTWELPDE